MTEVTIKHTWDYPKHEKFPKINRLENLTVTITEKLDGTNGLIQVTENRELLVGSRNNWLTDLKKDNHGFLAWCLERRSELLTLRPGKYYGEFCGPGIQRGYGLKEKHFYLFNISLDKTLIPACLDFVPILYESLPFTALLVPVHLVTKELGLEWMNLNPEKNLLEYLKEYQSVSCIGNNSHPKEGLMLFSPELGKYIKVIWGKHLNE